MKKSINPIAQEVCKCVATDLVTMDSILRRLDRQLRLLPSNLYEQEHMNAVKSSLLDLMNASKNFQNTVFEL